MTSFATNLIYSLILFTSVSASAQSIAPESFEFAASEISSLNIHNSMGRVDIAASLNDKASVVVQKARWGQRCTLKVELKGGVLSVISDDQSWILDSECRVDFTLSVPKTLDAVVRVGLGDVNVTAVEGNFDIKIGTGSADIKGDFKDLKTLTGKGGINFAGSSDMTALRAGLGNIIALYNSNPKASSKLIANVGLGDLRVSLPEDATVYLETMTGNGSIRNDFDQQKNSHLLEIKAYARSGDIKILKK